MTVDFMRAPAPTRLRAAVDADLRGRATPSQVTELRRPENLVTWLRLLNTIEKDIQNHTAKSRKAIAHLKPSSGMSPSPEYVAAKAHLDTMAVARLHAIEKVRTKRSEVTSLISDAGLTPHALGSVIDALVTLESILDSGEIDDAHNFITKLIDTYERSETT